MPFVPGEPQKETREMDIVIKGRHVDVKPDIKTYAEEKIGKVAHILNGMALSTEVELYHERNRSIGEHEVAEATLFTKGHVLRARESGSDMRSAIDKVAAKLERQARRFKDKVVDRHAGKGAAAPAPEEAVEQPEGEPEPSIVKVKQVDIKPMSREEAVLQLELLGHDFFLFASEDGDELDVLYRRRDGDYGLLRSHLG
jgi:putative sigma-54 modulation protein